VSSDFADRSFSEPSALVGAVTLGPVGAGELVQEGSVRLGSSGPPDGASADADGAGPEFSFPVDRERALAGDVRPGEEVDLLATFGSGSDATTEVLARRARILHVQEARTGTLGSSGRLVLTVGLGSDAEVVSVAHASEVAVITLVRPSGKGGRS
jgi:Flp pilus assembly protein CpaB